jgi:membrane dipeptidase
MLRKNFDNKWDEVDLENMSQYLSILTENEGKTHTDITRLRQGRVGGVFWVVSAEPWKFKGRKFWFNKKNSIKKAYASCDSNRKDAVMKHLDQVDIIRRLVEKRSDTFELVTSVAEINAAFKRGKISSLIGLESAHALDSSVAILRTFYELGTRYVTLTHNCDVLWATNNLVDVSPNAPNPVGGLTEFGKKMIAEMNRLGMIVDISHTSHKTQLDTLTVAKAPVIFSHSGVFSICGHTRNVRDDVLDKLVPI